MIELPFTFKPLEELPGLLLVESERFLDDWGWFMESYEVSAFEEKGFGLVRAGQPEKTCISSSGEGFLVYWPLGARLHGWNVEAGSILQWLAQGIRYIGHSVVTGCRGHGSPDLVGDKDAQGGPSMVTEEIENRT